MNQKKILVILGHPGKKSLCLKLAETYVSSAKKSGANVKFLNLAKMKFEPVLRDNSHSTQKLEKSLSNARKDILWAEHLVFVYPTWWGGPPALFRGFFERVFVSGFAFKNRKGKSMPEKLLRGKSARLIITTGGATIFSYLIGNATTKSIMKNSLRYCGIGPVDCTLFGSIRKSLDSKSVNAILSCVEKLGEKQI